MGRKIAAIDVGTNTAHLLLAIATDGRIESVVHDEHRFVRLGEGMEADGRIGEAGAHRLLGTLTAYGQLVDAWNADEVIVAGTSASRDAANGSEVVERVRVETGLEYEILSGQDEALWTSIGALAALPTLPPVAIVVDIGGGSTEITQVRTNRAQGARVDWARSLDVGSVRMTDRFFPSQPPGLPAIRAAEEAIDNDLARSASDLVMGGMVVGAGGTVQALGHVAGVVDVGVMAVSDTEVPELPRALIDDWTDRLLRLSFDETVALAPAVMTGRADVIAAGVLILQRVVAHIGCESCVVSPWGLRHGLILRRALSESRDKEQ